MESHSIAVQANGVRIAANLEPRVLLVHFLREQAGLTGTHIGYDTSQGGACTVRMDGTTAKSCTVLAGQADRHDRQKGGRHDPEAATRSTTPIAINQLGAA